VSTDTEDRRNLVKRYLHCFSDHDPTAALACLTNDHTLADTTTGQTYRGHEEVRGYFESWRVFAPDIQMDLSSSILDRDQAAIEWALSGTLQGPIPGLPPLPAALGKPFSIHGAAFLDFAPDGRIRTWLQFWSPNELMQQFNISLA